MAKNCTFCGLQLPRFGARELVCAGIPQPTCKDCYQKYVELPQEERCQLALDSGRATEPDSIRDFLTKKREQAQSERQDKLSGMTCLRCGGVMLKMGRQQFQLGEHSFFWGDMSHLMSGSMTLDVFQCEGCSKVEFFAPAPETDTKPANTPPQITCAVCGTTHRADIGCPSCALSGAAFGRRPDSAPPKKKEPKVPWEK